MAGGMHGRGPCVVGGMCDRGHTWQGACVVGGVWQGNMHGGGVHGQGACMAGGHAWQGGVHGRGACMAGDTATAADGTHPTGMHSYLP